MELTDEQKIKIISICADEHPTLEQIKQVLEEPGKQSEGDFLEMLKGFSSRQKKEV